MSLAVRTRSSRGFTLVELLVVIAIIGILISLLLPAVQAASKLGSVQDVVNIFNNDSRFRFLDQIPGALARINEALAKYGASLND